MAQRLPSPARFDFTGLYNPARRAQVDVRREADSLRLYVRFPDASVLRPGQPLRLVGWSNYNARSPLWQTTVPLGSRTLRREGTAAWVECRVLAAALDGVQVLVAWPAAYLPDDPAVAAWLELTPDMRSRSYILVDSVGQPLLRRYVRVGEPFGVDCYGPEQPLTVRRYTATFAPALPPYSKPAAAAKPRSLRAEAEQEVRAGQRMRLPEPGLYTIQPANAGAPVGVLAPNGAFPDLTIATELVAPLRYLTTSEERTRLEQSNTPKREVDAFWLRAANNRQGPARQLLQQFYSRVEEANQLFTAHKPGWMTDRGLLYIVLGPPNRVQRSPAEERWQYPNAGYGTATYVFRAKPSTFAPDYYELVRRPEYELLWYAAVEQWRTGLNAPRAEAGR
ncbi:GWxTD domain-containing protein [Hymenobacter busanensis]|nr:GWxTD domain-containing protein [Hymenobacter busanensis]QHJ09079.1 GWxTD domain-containing protein [Hymenobacter busanensis]